MQIILYCHIATAIAILMCHLSLTYYIKKRSRYFFYIAQYPVRWTAQSALHFLPSLADLLIPTPTRLLREAF